MNPKSFHLLFISLWIINNSYAFIIEEDITVYNRLEKFFEVKELAYNTHGWCSLIVALFLRTISLKTYETKVINVIQFNEKFSTGKLETYTENLIPQSSADSSPYYLSWITYIPEIPVVNGHLRGYYKDIQEKTYIQNYIQDIKERMMFIKSQDTSKSINKGIITAFGYPSIEDDGSDLGHAAVLWLTSNNDLVIIDPQLFTVTGKVTLFADSDSFKEMNFINNNIKLESLYGYFENRLSRGNSATTLLYKPHEKTYDYEEWKNTNPAIHRILKNIDIARARKNLV